MAEAVHLGFKARYSGWLQINLGHMGIQPVMNFNAGQYFLPPSGKLETQAREKSHPHGHQNT